MSIEIRGMDKLYRKLGRVQATNRLVRPMHNAVNLVQSDMADYPSPPAKSRYRRTGTLGRRWTTKVTTSSQGVQGKVGNNTFYAPLVQSDRFQLRLHRGRWQTDMLVIRRNRQRIAGYFQSVVNAALRGE